LHAEGVPDYVTNRVTTTLDCAALSADGWKFKNPPLIRVFPQRDTKLKRYGAANRSDFYAEFLG